MVLHLFCKQWSPYIQSWLSICYTVTRTVSWATTLFILPDPYMIQNILLVGWKVEDWHCLNLMCVAADPKDECHQFPRVETGQKAKWKMVRVGVVCTHNRLSCCKRQRAPTNQMSLCQRQPGIPEGVFQWWCCPRKTTTRRREWVSAEMAIPIPILMPSLGFTYLLRSLSNHHEAHRLWSNADISAFDIFFPMLYCMQDINSMTRRWSGTSCMESPEAYHWDSRTAGNPGKP